MTLMYTMWIFSSYHIVYSILKLVRIQPLDHSLRGTSRQRLCRLVLVFVRNYGGNLLIMLNVTLYMDWGNLRKGKLVTLYHSSLIKDRNALFHPVIIQNICLALMLLFSCWFVTCNIRFFFGFHPFFYCI